MPGVSGIAGRVASSPSMTKTTPRAATAGERARLEAYLSPAPAGNPGRLLGILVGVPVGFTAFVALNVLLPVPALVRLPLAVAIGAGTAALFGRWAAARHADMFRPAPEAEDVLRKDLAEGRVAVARYDAEAVVKVAADPGRFVGTTWFVKRADGSVVLLVGPHFEEAEEAGEFPATAFEVASGESSHYVLSVKSVGERLAPAAVRAPLSDAEWEEVGDDDDEEVPLAWTKVLERARLNPPRERAGDRRPPGPAAAITPEEVSGGSPVDPIRPK